MRRKIEKKIAAYMGYIKDFESTYCSTLKAIQIIICVKPKFLIAFPTYAISSELCDFDIFLNTRQSLLIPFRLCERRLPRNRSYLLLIILLILFLVLLPVHDRRLGSSFHEQKG